MKIRILFAALLLTAVSLRSADLPPEKANLLNLPLEMVAHIVLTHLEACTSLSELLKEIDRLRAVNTQLNKLFANTDNDFMKIILRRLKINNLTQQEKNEYLFKFVKNNHSLFATILLKLGADAHAKDKDNTTILHYAAFSKKNIHMTKILLQHGADVNALSAGMNVLYCIILGQDHRSLKFYQYRKNNYDETIKLLQLVELLLLGGADVTLEDECGATALYHAVIKNRHWKVIQLLLTYGADVNAKRKNWDGATYTALHHAAQNGNEHVVKLLLKHGAHVDTKANDGSTALHYATSSQPSLAKLLITAGIDVNIKNLQEGKTALWYANKSGNIEMIKLLIEAKANI